MFEEIARKLLKWFPELPVTLEQMIVVVRAEAEKYKHKSEVVTAPDDSLFMKSLKAQLRKTKGLYERKVVEAIKKEYVAPTEKRCSKCSIVRPIDRFFLVKGKHLSRCISCDYAHYKRPAALKRLAKKGSKPRAEMETMTAEEKRLKVNEYNRKYKAQKRADHPPKIPKVKEVWAEKPPVIRPKMSLEEKKTNKAAAAKRYRENNPENIKGERRRRNARPHVRIANQLRKRLKEFLEPGTKIGKFSNMTGCTKAELLQHIESQFQQGMTWENYGEWHIDHIRPMASFDLSLTDNHKLPNHYSNLRPMWAKDNQDKANWWDGSRWEKGKRVD